MSKIKIKPTKIDKRHTSTRRKLLSWQEEPSPRYANLSNCWSCVSHISNEKGHEYGFIKIYGIQIKVHRFVYSECFGEIPKGLVVRHKCDNKRCINPEHLELGTQRDNIHDAIKRLGMLIGRNNGSNKLSEDQVRAIKIRLKGNDTNEKIAKDFNVSRTNILHIKKGQTWAWLK